MGDICVSYLARPHDLDLFIYQYIMLPGIFGASSCRTCPSQVTAVCREADAKPNGKHNL